MSAENNDMAGFGLEDIGDLSGLLNEPESSTNSGSGPLMLPLDLIDEDPNQPRKDDNPGFSKESLGELAATILKRGVKTPISVRENVDNPGRYILNHGARRYRASKIAKKDAIPGYIDNDYNEADQVIENLQRNDLTAREIADYIGRELAKNIKKGEIAETIGKSAAFVSQHVTLLDLPDPIAKVFNTGRVNDVTVINELVKAHKNNPDEVVAWLDDEDQEISRPSVKLLREYLDDKREHEHDEEEEPAFTGQGDDDASQDQEDEDNPKPPKEPREVDPNKLKKAIVMVTHDNRSARLVLDRRPSSDGFAWLKYEDDGHEFEADLGDVQLMSLIEG
ncbi:TPA: ParB/RepB/Spo0J family partition protein [Vibrio parahaemolyticus]|uniref:ParB/RepB/Spo0J family partition protein n=1 Tax=Vibrio diabolicus TaxID=50719 RepID=UPI00249403D0|nr:ParB/RepB/Spo0J family partition protein [Vibrio diabolicus]